MTVSYDVDSFPETEEYKKRIAAQPKWEEFAKETYRLRIPGGWLYRHGFMKYTMVFVPEIGEK